MNIDFITFIGPNSADYAEYLKYTCEVYMSGKHKISWKCIESVNAQRLPKGYVCCGKAKNAGHNSMNHAMALNLASKYVEEDYVVFIDADMAIVHQDWDDIIVKELNENDCFGTSYNHNLKYRNFPNVYLFAFRKHILEKCVLDFSPLIQEGSEKPQRITITYELEPYFGIKRGRALKCDTGWKIPYIVKKAGFTGKSMPMMMMNGLAPQLPFEDQQHKNLCMTKPNHQYEWHYNGKIFATHKQASRTQPLNEIWGNSWKRRIDLYIKNTKGV